MFWLDEVYTNIEPLSPEEEYTQEDYDYTIVTTDKNIYCVLLEIEQEHGTATPITRYLINLDKYPLSDDIMKGIHGQKQYTIDIDSPNGFVQILSQSTQMSPDIRTDFIEWLQVVTHSNAGSAINSSISPVYDFSILLPVAPASPMNMLVSYGEAATSRQISSTVLNPDLTEFSTLVPTLSIGRRKRINPDPDIPIRRSLRIRNNQ